MLQKRLFAILSVLLGMAVSFGAFAQKQTVTGTVLDSTGPVIGAVLQGKDANAVTDMDGKFAITVSPQDVLTVSCLGYISKQVPVAGRTNLTITLEEALELFKTSLPYTLGEIEGKEVVTEW